MLQRLPAPHQYQWLDESYQFDFCAVCFDGFPSGAQDIITALHKSWLMKCVCIVGKYSLYHA